MGLEMLVAVVAAEKHFLAYVALVRALQFTCAQATEGDQHFTLVYGCCGLLKVGVLNSSTYTTLQAKLSIFLVCERFGLRAHTYVHVCVHACVKMSHKL